MEQRAGLSSRRLSNFIMWPIASQMDVSRIHGTEGLWREAVSRCGLRFRNLSREKAAARQGVLCWNAVLQPRKHVYQVVSKSPITCQINVFSGLDPSSREVYRRDWPTRRVSDRPTMPSPPPRLRSRTQVRSLVPAPRTWCMCGKRVLGGWASCLARRRSNARRAWGWRSCQATLPGWQLKLNEN